MNSKTNGKSAPVDEVRGLQARSVSDVVAIEEPLEIHIRTIVDGVAEDRPLTITMRTPGADRELAAGFLFTEGLIRAREQIAGIEIAAGNAVIVELAPGVTIDTSATRGFVTTSACGVCGKTSLDTLRAEPAGPIAAGPTLPAALIHDLPATLRKSQQEFESTGGQHASGLFDTGGTLLLSREDVGRHNAVDKVIGALLLDGKLPAATSLLLVSGRASFELVQKALMARIPILAAVGAPSSAAVELAAGAGMTLLGFVRDGRFNVYCGRERISGLTV